MVYIIWFFTAQFWNGSGKCSSNSNSTVITSGLSGIEKKFVRTCPVGVKSCFAAKGVYDRNDARIEKDISKFYLRITAIGAQLNSIFL